MAIHNDYDKLVDQYSKSHIKPDKQYSMLPTILALCSGGKHIVDVGCGDGFFTEQLANTAEKVTGIDISEQQLHKAREKQIKHAVFQHADMNTFDYSRADVVNAPYVINYLETIAEVQHFFSRVYKGIKKGGKIVGIVDMPNSTIHDMQKFGSIKCVDALHDEEEITLQLFHEDEEIITLKSIFYSRETLGNLLVKAGFRQVVWHTPIVSDEGIKRYGEDFWKEYIQRCDVAYFSAVK